MPGGRRRHPPTDASIRRDLAASKAALLDAGRRRRATVASSPVERIGIPFSVNDIIATLRSHPLVATAAIAGTALIVAKSATVRRGLLAGITVGTRIALPIVTKKAVRMLD